MLDHHQHTSKENRHSCVPRHPSASLLSAWQPSSPVPSPSDPYPLPRRRRADPVSTPARCSCSRQRPSSSPSSTSAARVQPWGWAIRSSARTGSPGSAMPAGRGATVMTVVATSPTALTTQVLTTLDLPDGQIILQGIGDGPTGPADRPGPVHPGRDGGHRSLPERPRIRRHHRPARRYREHRHPAHDRPVLTHMLRSSRLVPGFTVRLRR